MGFEFKMVLCDPICVLQGGKQMAINNLGMKMVHSYLQENVYSAECR